MNLPSVIILLVILALAAIAIKALRSGRGTCSCEGKGKKSTNCSKCAGCTVDCPLKRKA